MHTLGTVSVTGKIDAARNQLSPEVGASDTIFEQQAIDQLPLGVSTSLNQVLLRAPGVVNDSFGQLHVRGDHGNVQYRINGVIIPESISGFGQALDAPRLLPRPPERLLTAQSCARPAALARVTSSAITSLPCGPFMSGCGSSRGFRHPFRTTSGAAVPQHDNQSSVPA